MEVMRRSVSEFVAFLGHELAAPSNEAATPRQPDARSFLGHELAAPSNKAANP